METMQSTERAFPKRGRPGVRQKPSRKQIKLFLCFRQHHGRGKRPAIDNRNLLFGAPSAVQYPSINWKSRPGRELKTNHKKNLHARQCVCPEERKQRAAERDCYAYTREDVPGLAGVRRVRSEAAGEKQSPTSLEYLQQILDPLSKMWSHVARWRKTE
ncbi:hypothetical protein TGMAS_226820 [Toxoplasma gondii MAS]|uniref:Uncharacterized protein n=1 Tax=Toxoplasma gondii MAS TaxID=943118 RepID=A0A086QB21_TOXGO|nr:hypothetical protein TGMAS_226820 [Toxoplasma gondii MAS]